MPRRSGGPRAVSVPPGVGVVSALDWNHRAVKCVAFDPGLGKLAGQLSNEKNEIERQRIENGTQARFSRLTSKQFPGGY